MRTGHLQRTALALMLALAMDVPAHGTDVDGGDDCQRTPVDFGDAPEGVVAYPGGVIGHFPTCLAAAPPGTANLVCSPGGLIGLTGFVRHVHLATASQYWLGCGVV